MRVLGTYYSAEDGKSYACVLSIERIPFGEGEIAGRLTSPEGYAKLDKVSACPLGLQRRTTAEPDHLTSQVMSNDVFLTARGWLSPGEREGADLKLTAICPATDKASQFLG